MAIKPINNPPRPEVRNALAGQLQTSRVQASPSLPSGGRLQGSSFENAAAKRVCLLPQLETGPELTFSQRFVQAAQIAAAKRIDPGRFLQELLSILSPADDAIALFDTFGEGITHGDDVRHVVEENSKYDGGEIRPVRVGSTPAPRGASLDERIEHRVTSFLDSTSDAIQGILDNRGQINVINQSQSISPVRVVEDLWREVRNDPKERAALAKELGLDADATDKELLQALADHVDKVFETSPEIAKAKERYDALSAELEEAGILHVVTAGNTGDFLDELDDLGVTYDRDFSNSVLFNEHKIVVAASTGGRDDQIAEFSTPSDYVTVAIDGTDIPVESGTSNGTSFAAPQVTALIAEMRRIDPSLTNDEIRDILAKAATDTAASAREEGHGILDPDKALALVRLSLLKEILAARMG